MRKGAVDLQKALEEMVIPMFCYSKVLEAANDDHTAKLNKLLNLWETKSNYVSAGAADKLRNYGQSWIEYQNELITRHAVVVSQIAQNIQKTYESYQAQHTLFCQHVTQSIKVGH